MLRDPAYIINTPGCEISYMPCCHILIYIMYRHPAPPACCAPGLRGEIGQAASISFIEHPGQDARLVAPPPTGSAAAATGGSTPCFPTVKGFRLSRNNGGRGGKRVFPHDHCHKKRIRSKTGPGHVAHTGAAPGADVPPGSYSSPSMPFLRRSFLCEGLSIIQMPNSAVLKSSPSTVVMSSPFL